jgi:cytoskeletal protein RodZ
MNQISLEIKAAIAAAVLVVFALVAWFGWHEYKAHLADQSTMGQQTQVIADQHNTIQTQASSAAVTDTVVASSVQADQAAQATSSKIDAWIATQTSQINSKYANGPTSVVAPTPASGTAVATKPVAPAPATVSADQAGDVVPTGKEAEISAVQLTGSWMKYCAAIGDADPKCASVPQAQ